MGGCNFSRLSSSRLFSGFILSEIAQMIKGDYIERALACLPETGLEVLELIKNRGGTSGDYFDILNTYTSLHHESNSFMDSTNAMWYWQKVF